MLLYFYTRRGHAELSTLVLICRTGEAVLFGAYALGIFALVFIAEFSTHTTRDTDASLVVRSSGPRDTRPWWACFFFAIGSAAFAWVFIRARLAPRYLATLGLVGSLVPVVGMPLQIIGALRGFNTGLLWVLMFLFELALGVWLLTSGGRDPE